MVLGLLLGGSSSSSRGSSPTARGAAAARALPSPRSRPREGDSRQPANLLRAHWLPFASAAPGGGVGAGRGGAVAAPSRAGKGAGDAAKSPTGRHLPARPPRREPGRGREALSRAHRHAWRRCAQARRSRKVRGVGMALPGRAPQEDLLLAGQPMVGVAVSFLEIKACPGSSVFGETP